MNSDDPRWRHADDDIEAMLRMLGDTVRCLVRLGCGDAHIDERIRQARRVGQLAGPYPRDSNDDDLPPSTSQMH